MLRSVRHATFEQLSAAGHDVRFIDDGAEPLDPARTIGGNPPEHWMLPQPVVAPKIATLRDAILFIDGSALLPDGLYCYFDTCFATKGWHSPRAGKVLHSIDPETDRSLIWRKSHHIDVPGRCFSTRSNNRNNFAHFAHDVLSRIYYEYLGVIEPGRDKVIAPRMRMPMQKILFQKVFEGYEIVQVPPGVPLRVEELLLPANLCHDEMFNPLAIAVLAERMRHIMEPYVEYEKRKVCVSRRDGKRRRGKQYHGRDFINADAFESLMGKLGYQIVNVSILDPDTQLSLWANTSDIVGIHGSGMMNMIMMASIGNYTEIAGSPTNPTRNGIGLCPNHILRCALAAGHRVCGLANVRDGQGRPIVDIERLEMQLMNAK